MLAVRDRFRTIAGAYVVGAGAGLVAYLAVSGPRRRAVLAWSMLAMAVVTCALMLFGLRRSDPGARGQP